MSYDSVILADSPVRYYKLNETSGTSAADSSGTGAAAATIVNSPTLGVTGLLAGESETAIALNGSTQYITVPRAADIDVSSYTIECWVKIASGATADAIVMRDDSAFDLWGLRSVSSHAWFGCTASGYAQSSSPNIKDNAPHHLVGVRDNSTGKFSAYVDGNLVGGPTAFTVPTTSSIGFWIGRRGDGSIPTAMTVEKVAFYPTALSGARIAAHFAAAAVTTTTATASMSAQASLGDAGTDTVSQTVALSAQASLADPPAITKPGVDPMSAQASLAAVGVVGTVVGLAAAAGLGDGATVEHTATEPLSAQASLSAPAGVTESPADSMSAQASLGDVGVVGSADAMSAAAGLTAPPVVDHPSASGLSALATLADASDLTHIAADAMSALATLGAAGTAIAADVTLGLPPVEFTFDAPAVALTAAVTLGLPPVEFTFDAPAVYLGNRKPLDRIVGHLYQGNGLTHISMLRIRNGKWREVVSQAGSASFDVPLDDASTEHITARRVVKLTWYRNGRAVKTFSCEIRSEGIELAVDGKRWLRFEDQPGCLIKLSDGIVRPEYGLRKYSPENRLFGPMSASGPWLLDGNWRKPRGYPMAEDRGHYRFGFPPQLVKSNPDWVAAAWPRLGQPTGKKNYFRWSLPIPSGGAYVQIVPTADNFLTMWHNGEEIITANPENPLGWMSADPLPLHLDAGVHEFAAMVENAPFPRANGYSPMGLIFTIFELNTAGKVIGILLKSNEVDLLAHDDQPEPGWFRAQVLYQLIAEAKAFGYVGPTQLRVGFTPYHDSAGRSWSTTPRGTYSFAIGEDLASVTDTLTEAHFDVTFDHVTMTVKAWIRAGRDRTSTVHILPGDQGGNLKSGASASTHARFTEVLTHRADGSWADVIDTAGRDAIGMVGTSLDLGTAGSESTAAEVGRSQLRDSAKTQRSFTSQPSTVSGVIPYIHYFPGDYVSIPNERNTALTSGRALAITVDGSGDVVEAYSEIVEDLVPA